jgi:predicted ATPase
MDTQALDWISIEGFKSIANSGKVPLHAINLVIGANGVGKSNFVEIFALLQALREGRLQNYVKESAGANEILHFGSKKTPEIKLGFASSGEVNSYEIVLRRNEQDSLFPQSEVARFWDKKRYARPYENGLSAEAQGTEAGISKKDLHHGAAKWVGTRINRLRIYHLHDTSKNAPLRTTNKIDDNDYLRPDGSNLAAFLYRLQETSKHQETFAFICQTIQLVAPFFDAFLLRPDNLNPEIIRLAWRHKGSDKYFGVSSLSDGTLRFIALATLLLQPVELRPSVILIDEPELGLHPAAISLLASLIHDASLNTQVIVATQSPQLLDHFEPADVLVAERENGATVFKRLENEDYTHWLEDYSLGQLWEKNELGGRPGPD